MDLQQHIPLGPKTTMRIGGTARYYAELLTKEDCEEAAAFAAEKKIPLIVLGGGSNTIFDDAEIEALVVRMKAEETIVDGNSVTVRAGKILGSLLNECAESGLDLTSLTGIPGTIGGAIFGNAGQGPQGIWISSFVRTVTAFVDGVWRTFDREECGFEYRESVFKQREGKVPPIIWEVTLAVPRGEPTAIRAEIERLIQKRIETQPHLKTAGSCFKAVGGTPAWQLIDRAGLRGLRIGDVEISPKHANFLMNVGKGSFADAKRVVETVREKIPEELEVEMRFVERDGTVAG